MTVDCYDFADIWGTEEFSNWSVPQRTPDIKQDQAKTDKVINEESPDWQLKCSRSASYIRRWER